VDPGSNTLSENKRVPHERARGHFRHLLLYVVAWGIPMALTIAGLDSWRGRAHFLSALPLALAVFGIGGGLLGEVRWRSNRARCNRVK